MKFVVRPELPTASVGSSQAPTAAVDNSAPFATRPQSTYKSGKVVQTSGATSFSLYFVRPGARTAWDPVDTEVGFLRLANGDRVFVFARMRPTPLPFQATVERLLRENVFGMQRPTDFLGGSFLWLSESEDVMKVPMIVDLPVPMRFEST